MLVAARQLLAEEGPGAVTHQRVAAEAGVGRATVYRHWPRPEQLLTDVMSGVDLPLFKDPEAPVRGWLHRQLRQMAEDLSGAAVAAFSLTLMQTAIWDAQIAHQRDESLRTITERLAAGIQTAIDGGELEAAAVPDDLSAMLVGPIIYRATMQRGVVSDELITRLVDSVGTWRQS